MAVAGIEQIHFSPIDGRVEVYFLRQVKACLVFFHAAYAVIMGFITMSRNIGANMPVIRKNI